MALKANLKGSPSRPSRIQASCSIVDGGGWGMGCSEERPGAVCNCAATIDECLYYDECLVCGGNNECLECPGDMNGDGSYNVLDIVALQECILTATCIAGDMDGNGSYNVLDILALAECVLTATCCSENSTFSYEPPPRITKVEQDQILRNILSAGQDINQISSILEPVKQKLQITKPTERMQKGGRILKPRKK